MNGRRWCIPLLLLLPLGVLAQEICNNGIDDDGDGLIDLNDPDCPCSILVNLANTPSLFPNHSFEEQSCCPYDITRPGADWFQCLDSWHHGNASVTDYFHECGFSPDDFPMPPPDGQGAVGLRFAENHEHNSYVGACLTFQDPAGALQEGVTYTLSFWIAGMSITQRITYSGPPINFGVYYEEGFSVALYGNADCVPFPVAGGLCMGDVPGWEELGTAWHQPDGEWTRVSMTFTPDKDIRSVALGIGCGTPPIMTSYMTIVHPISGEMVAVKFYPYMMLDDLLLTEAPDQVLLPVSHTGHVCQENVVVTGDPPVGATDHQWYLDGVAIVGQTGLVLNASDLDLGSGRYTMASNFQGQCLMGNTTVPPPIVAPLRFAHGPYQGCAPLTVSFRDTTHGELVHRGWDFGDGSTGSGQHVEHTYTASGTYDVALTVTTEQGCSRDSVFTAIVEVFGAPAGAITAAPNPVSAESPVVELSGSGSSDDVISWWWDLGEVPPGVFSGETLSVTFPSEAGSYPVMLVVTNANDCVDTVQAVVLVIGALEMPNVFSPNGDGANDVFLPLRHAGVPGLLEIYNRWGQKVFSTEALDVGWNGRMEGGEAPDGTYYYVVTPYAEGEEVLSGHVTLLR